VSTCYSQSALPPVQVVFIEFAILVASLSFHEAAHAWTADRLGDPTARLLGRLTLNPLAHVDLIGTIVFPLVAMLSGIPIIGWAKPVPVDMRHFREPRRNFAIVAAAGPVSNLALASGAAILYRLVLGSFGDPTPPMAMAAEGLRFFVVINVLLAVFNMIPVPPLDGGNVLMGLVPERAALTIGWLRPYGFLILYVLMFSGMLYQVMGPVSRALLSWLL
jgi:Zn-dependent protease